MRSKKLAQRLKKITEELERRGIGSTFCECPNSDGINARRIVASILFPEIDLIDDPVEVCSEHNPRPTQKPKGDGTEMLHQLLLREDLKIAEEEREIWSFAQVFASLPLETRLARIESESGESKRLKTSIFDRLDYQMQQRKVSS